MELIEWSMVVQVERMVSSNLLVVTKSGIHSTYFLFISDAISVIAEIYYISTQNNIKQIRNA